MGRICPLGCSGNNSFMVTLSRHSRSSPVWAVFPSSCGWAVIAAGMLVCWTGPLQQEPLVGH